MALSARRRRRLPDSAFAYPKQRKYPLDTPKRRRNALSRAAQPGTFGTYSHVAAAIRRKLGSSALKSVRKGTGSLTAPSGKRANRSRPLRSDEKAAIRRERARRSSSRAGGRPRRQTATRAPAARSRTRTVSARRVR